MLRTMSISLILPLMIFSCALRDCNVDRIWIRIYSRKKYSNENICWKGLEPKIDNLKTFIPSSNPLIWQQRKSWKLKLILRKKEIGYPHRFQETGKNSISRNSNSRTRNWRKKSFALAWKMKNWKNKFKKAKNLKDQRYILKRSTTNLLSYLFFWVSYAWSECWKRLSSRQLRLWIDSKQVKNLNSFRLLIRNWYLSKPYQKWLNSLKMNKLNVSYCSISKGRLWVCVDLRKTQETVWDAGSWQDWWKSWIK